MRLEPLRLVHVEALAEVALDPELWRWTLTQIGSIEELRDYVLAALEEQGMGRSLPFVTIDRTSGRAVGSTRFGNLEPEHRRVEIGWTWIARPWQRTAINTEAKLLMLGHAFDRLGCQRVELKTDARNTRSREAIRRLGAVEEGVFRRHLITAEGRARDTAWYSILAEEWPAVRGALTERLARGGG